MSILAKTKRKSNTKIKLALDVLIFIGFLIAMDPRSSGIAVHEWLTVSSMAAVVTHILLSWDWIVQLTRRCFETSAKRFSSFTQNPARTLGWFAQFRPRMVAADIVPAT